MSMIYQFTKNCVVEVKGDTLNKLHEFVEDVCGLDSTVQSTARRRTKGVATIVWKILSWALFHEHASTQSRWTLGRPWSNTFSEGLQCRRQDQKRTPSPGQSHSRWDWRCYMVACLGPGLPWNYRWHCSIYDLFGYIVSCLLESG